MNWFRNRFTLVWLMAYHKLILKSIHALKPFKTIHELIHLKSFIQTNLSEPCISHKLIHESIQVLLKIKINQFKNWFMKKAWGYWTNSQIDSFMIKNGWLVDVLIKIDLWIDSSMIIQHLNWFKNQSLVIFTVSDPHIFIASCLICKYT